jgi:hypothetical protein
MQKSLSLAFATAHVALLTMKVDLPNMSSHCRPPLDLSKVFLGHSTARVVTAIPLEPTSGIVGMNPSVLAPHR